jgi:hypothetical protein
MWLLVVKGGSGSKNTVSTPKILGKFRAQYSRVPLLICFWVRTATANNSFRLCLCIGLVHKETGLHPRWEMVFLFEHVNADDYGQVLYFLL